MQVLKTTVGQQLLALSPENVAFHIASFLVDDEEENRAREEYKQLLEQMYRQTMKGKKLQFLRYCKNLRYDSFYVYSYSTAVIQLNWRERTAKRLGKWSKTTSTHMNYSIKMLIMCYDFKEIK